MRWSFGEMELGLLIELELCLWLEMELMLWLEMELGLLLEMKWGWPVGGIGVGFNVRVQVVTL